jgi:SAM-dependent methyltransferase
MNPDPWLDRWLPLLARTCAGRPLLELGCGGGQDTAILAEAGHAVIALDLDPERLVQARLRCPSAEFHHQDLRAPFPVEDGVPGAVVASLSLHYFPWLDTQTIVDRIQACLEPGGLLLCRLNSTRDHHYGANGHPAIAENFYQVGAATKRFFDEGSVRRLFSQGWSFLSLEELEIHRYERPKVVWEAVLARAAQGSPSHEQPSGDWP